MGKRCASTTRSMKDVKSTFKELVAWQSSRTNLGKQRRWTMQGLAYLKATKA